MKKIITLLFIGIFFTANASVPFDWGRTGHRSTAEIATTYLSKKTKRKVKHILEGKSLALISTFGDDIKSDSRYNKYSTWHYLNIPKGKTYDEVKASLGPNLVSAIDKCVSKLENRKTSKSDQQFYLKMLVHLIGDLGQPLHVGHEADRGGNDIKVKWFGHSSNLHKVWDSEMINSFQMSYSELAMNQAKLSKREISDIQAGNVLDWVKDSQDLAAKVYASAKDGDHLGYRYMYLWMPKVREQLQKGGIRLAKILNEIYD